MNRGSGFWNRERLREWTDAFAALFGFSPIHVIGSARSWWRGDPPKDRVAVVSRIERPDNYVVAGETTVASQLLFSEAMRLGLQKHDEGEVALVGQVLGDGTFHVLQFFPKEESMSDKPQGKHFPIHPNYDRSQPPIGYLVLDEEEAAKHDLGALVIAPGGVADDDGHITEVVEFGIFPAERLRRREGMARLPLFGVSQRDEPLGYVELQEHLTNPGSKDFVARPILEPQEEGPAPTKAVSFELVHPETVGSGVPIQIGALDSEEGSVVGVVRLSESMVFQFGNIGDLELVPTFKKGTDELAAYKVVNKSHRMYSTFENLEPGSYIFRVTDGGVPHSLEQIPDRHVVEFGPDKYSMQHPYECRAGGRSLHDCDMWDRVTAKKDKFEDRGLRGRYFVDYDEDGDRLVFEEVPEADRLGADLRSEEWGVRMNEGTSDPGAIRQAVSRAAAEAAAIGVGVVVRRGEDGEWVEVSPDDD